MKKFKTACHICLHTMTTPANEEAPCFCELCGTNVQQLNDEARVLDTTISTEAGGVKADVVYVILTNKRIIFTGDKSNNTGSWIGWLLGGIIGGLIAGAISGAKGSGKQLISVKFENMASLDVEYGTKLLNRNTRFFTIYDKDGNAFAFQPGKKEADDWENAIRAQLPQQMFEM